MKPAKTRPKVPPRGPHHPVQDGQADWPDDGLEPVWDPPLRDEMEEAFPEAGDFWIEPADREI